VQPNFIGILWFCDASAQTGHFTNFIKMGFVILRRNLITVWLLFVQSIFYLFFINSNVIHFSKIGPCWWTNYRLTDKEHVFLSSLYLLLLYPYCTRYRFFIFFNKTVIDVKFWGKVKVTESPCSEENYLWMFSRLNLAIVLTRNGINPIELKLLYIKWLK